MKNVMLDLEMMGTNNNAAIVAIGACLFNASEIGKKFYRNVDLTTSTGRIDGGTVYWWLEQSPEARAALLVNKLSEQAALEEFSLFLPVGAKLWGNGATFDNIVLRSAYQRQALPISWSFRNDMCYRTIKAMAVVPLPKREGTHHNALDDAVFQAQHMIMMAEVHPVIRKMLA